MSTNPDASTVSYESSADTERLKSEIEHTRDGLAETVAALEEKLAPSQVREAVSAELQLVEDRIRNVVGDQLKDAKALLEAQVQEAKEFLRTGLTDAERRVRTGLSDARKALGDELKVTARRAPSGFPDRRRAMTA